MGYGVRDRAGRWYDVPSHPVTLAPGRESATRGKTWRVPPDPLTTTGPYAVRASVWGSRPEAGGAVRVASIEREASFEVRNFFEGFDSPNTGRWVPVDQELGRGRLHPENVGVDGGLLRLKLPAKKLDGGAVRSRSFYKHGVYAARIKTPYAPSSMTAFFLYAAPDYEKEIDVEIPNDGSRRVLLSTYAPHRDPEGNPAQKPAHTVTKTLPFDPAAGFHDYSFSFYPDGVSFRVDGRLVQSWSDGLPREPMNLWVNAWFPSWMRGESPSTDRYLYVDWVRH